MASNNGSSRLGPLGDTAALILRIAIGVIFLAHGSQKLGLIPGGSVQSTVGFMGKMGIPWYLAYLNIAAEFGGGLGLIFGFLTRVAALGIVVSMIVAIAVVHLPNGFLMSNRGYEYPLALAAISLYFLAMGGGPYSIDRFIRFRPKRT